MLEYGLPLIAVGYAVVMIGFLAFSSRRLDKARAKIERQASDARKAAIEAAEGPDLNDQIATVSRTASLLVKTAGHAPRSRSLAVKRTASRRQHA